MLPYPKNTNPLPHPSKTSPKNHFLRPFIKPIPLSQANKENQATPNINKPTTPLNKKQAVFTGNPRKFSLTPQETNDLLSPGHYPQSSHKIPTFKSPQRKTPSYFNVKGDSSRQTTFFNSPENNKKSTYNYAINDKNSNNNNNSLANESHLKETKNKENIFDRMKVFSNDIMQSAKSFINHKLNSLSAREKCACETGLKSEETCQKAFKWLYKRYKKNDLVYLKNLYEKLQNNLLVEEVTRSQISRDILRTYPNCDLFKEGHDGTKILERVLLTFACYDPQIGYVQGMNYIAGFFLYHAEEFIAFWLLALIFELFELRDIYLPNLPGLSKHLQIIDMLIFAHTPELYKHLIAQCVTSEMYCSPWIFSLFGMVIPLEEMLNFYDEFLEKGWTFFYQLILGFLLKESQRLLNEEGMGTLQILTQNNYKILKIEDYQASRNYWRNLLRSISMASSCNPQINSQLISKLHSNYNQETKTFKLLINTKDNSKKL